jgi:hypothetical protein
VHARDNNPGPLGRGTFRGHRLSHHAVLSRDPNLLHSIVAAVS